MANKRVSAVDHIITNSIFNNGSKTAIINTDISDHFPITYAFELRGSMSSENQEQNGHSYKCMEVQRQH